jgi:transposase-like protein
MKSCPKCRSFAVEPLSRNRNRCLDCGYTASDFFHKRTGMIRVFDDIDDTIEPPATMLGGGGLWVDPAPRYE